MLILVFAIRLGIRNLGLEPRNGRKTACKVKIRSWLRLELKVPKKLFVEEAGLVFQNFDLNLFLNSHVVRINALSLRSQIRPRCHRLSTKSLNRAYVAAELCIKLPS